MAIGEATLGTDLLRQHTHCRRNGRKPSPYANGSSLMERMADGDAGGTGTVASVRIGSAIITGWVLVNAATPNLEHAFIAIPHDGKFDPEPWILLSLIFFGVASTPARW